jgi:hypothetical protein
VAGMGHDKPKKTPRHARQDEQRISRKSRNRLLGVALAVLVADALLAIVFTLIAPTDPRLADVFASRRQSRIIYMQGIVSIIDAVVSVVVVVHVVHGVLSASLDAFLDGAATKLLQAIFFSLLQTGYPTMLRLLLVTGLLLLRVAAAALIFRAAFLSGVLTARPSRQLPKLIVSLLEMGAPVPPPGMHAKLQQAKLYAIERPLTIELTESLLRWLVPLRERAAAVGTGRRQIVVIATFILLMTAYAAFSEYWAILGARRQPSQFRAHTTTPLTPPRPPSLSRLTPPTPLRCSTWPMQTHLRRRPRRVFRARTARSDC